MEKNKDMNEEELKAQQEETLDNVATSQPDEGDKAEEQANGHWKVRNGTEN